MSLSGLMSWDGVLFGILTFSLFFVFAVGVVVFFHELGHVVALYIFNQRLPKVHFKPWWILVGDYKKDYAHLSDFERVIVYAGGIFLGLIPMVAIGSYFPGTAILLFIAYLFMISNDVQNLVENLNVKKWWFP